MRPNLTTSLYHLWDDAGYLLYIGIAHDVHDRMKQHVASQSWIYEVAAITCREVGQRRDALAVEAEEIQRWNPRHNIRKASNKRPWEDDTTSVDGSQVRLDRMYISQCALSAMTFGTAINPCPDVASRMKELAALAELRHQSWMRAGNDPNAYSDELRHNFGAVWMAVQ